jgi:hypothetical protein
VCVFTTLLPQDITASEQELARFDDQESQQFDVPEQEPERVEKLEEDIKNVLPQEAEQIDITQDDQQTYDPEAQQTSDQSKTPIIMSDFQKAEDVQDELQEVEGIHTVDLNEPEGNWLFKRIWWEKCKKLYGKIRERVDKIVESRMHFFTERVKLDREYIDPFYISIGFDQGALSELVQHLFELLKIDREAVGALSERELEQYNLVTEEKNKLEQLQSAVIDVQQLSNGIDEALKNLMEQVNLARSYEREAWQNLEAIAEELSDKKAREHYYIVANLWRNIKDIGNYIIGPFSQHFVQLGTTVNQRINSIQEILEALKAKGVMLAQKIEETHESSPTQDEEDEEQEEDLAPVKVGWFAWLWQIIKRLFSW